MASPSRFEHWEPFPDTVPALKRLKSRYKLAVLSNIDDDLFAFTAPKLGVAVRLCRDGAAGAELQTIVRNFETLLDRLRHRERTDCFMSPRASITMSYLHMRWESRPSGSTADRAGQQRPPDWSQPSPTSKCRPRRSGGFGRQLASIVPTEMRYLNDTQLNLNREAGHHS